MDTRALAQSMLGYLNLSDGTPSAAFRRGVNDFYRHAEQEWVTQPWHKLFELLDEELRRLSAESAPFRDAIQARTVLDRAPRILDAYRDFHRDLLVTLDDRGLFNAFFLARVFEAGLAAAPSRISDEAAVTAALDRINDFIGHRPVAVLEDGRGMQPYAGEWVAPVPIYFRDVGPVAGKYELLIQVAVDTLTQAPANMLADSWFSLERLEEIAIDPRPYDHAHPVNQRPAYQFGEWDPHAIDGKGYYWRFVLRPMILDALLDWIGQTTTLPREEAYHDAAVVLAGTILLASGISGDGPAAHDSETSLSSLVAKVARNRDAFYWRMLESASGKHGERLRHDADLYRQPFGAVRQYLNQHLAKQRATQLQHHHLALIFASLGYEDLSDHHAAVIPTASVRIRTQIQKDLTQARRMGRQRELRKMTDALLNAEQRIRRGIECGALLDPWNILGFAGNFNVFYTSDNSVLDPRVEQLLLLMERMFDSYGRLLREAAAIGDDATRKTAAENMKRLADWWDKYASFEVSGVRRVHGGESLASADFVSEVLADWRTVEAGPASVAFWKRHAHRFNSPHAYTLVVEALLQRHDLIGAMALLVHWLGNVEQAPLGEGPGSFHSLAAQWLALAVEQALQEAEPEDDKPDLARLDSMLTLIVKFFDFLEANAEEYWQVPGLSPGSTIEAEPSGPDASNAEPTEGLFAAAYETMVYRDSTADGQEGTTLEGSGANPTQLEEINDHLPRRLQFLDTLTRLWQVTAAAPWEHFDSERRDRTFRNWTQQSLRLQRQLTRLLDALHHFEIARPSGGHDAIVLYDRQQSTKQQLLAKTIATAIETAHAASSLLVVTPWLLATDDAGRWEPRAIALLRALRSGKVDEARKLLPTLLASLREASLLYVPIEQGGDPRAVYSARYVRDTLRKLAAHLPRLGLYRETYHLLNAALTMERSQSSAPHQVTEFNLLFPVGFKGVIDNLVDSMGHWPTTRDDDEEATTIVGTLVGRFSKLWLSHLSSVRLSELERRSESAAWNATLSFIRRYGRGLFSQKFMAFSNLRGILHRGVGAFLDDLQRSDSGEWGKLVGDLGGAISRDAAAEHLEFVLRVILENYDAYKDYNSTTTQSDYGENLWILFELLKVQAGYERYRWALQPAYLAHGILARKRRPRAAELLQRAFAEETAPIADDYLAKLSAAESAHGVRLASIRDRLGERFIKPLRLDRILALVEPVMADAEQETRTENIARFEREVVEFSESSMGAGLDVPQWIRQIETEISRLSDRRAIQHERIEERIRARNVQLTFADLRHQLDTWEKPLLGRRKT